MRTLLELVCDGWPGCQLSNSRRKVHSPNQRRLGSVMATVSIHENVSKARYLIITALAIAFDQFTKYWVTQRLGEGGEITVIKNFFVISYTENPGIAFGMLGNANV